MRPIGFLTPLLVIFIINCTNFAYAENIIVDRRLRAEARQIPGVPGENAAKVAADFITKLQSQVAQTKQLQEKTAKLAGEFITKLKMKEKKYLAELILSSKLKDEAAIRSGLVRAANTANDAKMNRESTTAKLLEFITAEAKKTV